MKKIIKTIVILLLLFVGFTTLYINRDYVIDKTKTTLRIKDSRDNEVTNYKHRPNSNYYNLNDNEKIIYDYLHDKCLDILNNQSTSTTIEINNSKLITDNDYNLNKVLRYFNADYPYLSWWTDSLDSISHIYDENILSNMNLTIYLHLSSAYKSESSDTDLKVDLVNKAHDSYNKAKEIANVEYEDINEKLNFYKEYILNSVSYDENARTDDDSSLAENYDYLLASSFLNTFDEDDSTNVICGGYSESFLLLCDLGGIETCYYTSGHANGGSHAWNTLVIDDIRYIADVTNMDEGTIGTQRSLFMEEIPYSNEYSFVISNDLTYTYIETDLSSEFQ